MASKGLYIQALTQGANNILFWVVRHSHTEAVTRTRFQCILHLLYLRPLRSVLPIRTGDRAKLLGHIDELHYSLLSCVGPDGPDPMPAPDGANYITSHRICMLMALVMDYLQTFKQISTVLRQSMMATEFTHPRNGPSGHVDWHLFCCRRRASVRHIGGNVRPPPNHRIPECPREARTVDVQR